jgi:hypothetical protein
MAGSLGISQSNELFVRQSPAGKNVTTETEDPSPGNDCRRHSTLRKITVYCSELQSDSAVVTCSHDL